MDESWVGGMKSVAFGSDTVRYGFCVVDVNHQLGLSACAMGPDICLVCYSVHLCSWHCILGRRQMGLISCAIDADACSFSLCALHLNASYRSRAMLVMLERLRLGLRLLGLHVAYNE